MDCPYLNENTRTCIKRIKVHPHNLTFKIFKLCMDDRYLECPFYKILSGKDVCTNILDCAAFKNFQAEEFGDFMEIANQYCTSINNFKNCQRYIKKEKGEDISICLHPDGHCEEKWKKYVGDECICD